MIENRKASLALTAPQRGDYAWSLVLDTGLSKAEIAKACGISSRTVARMRVARRQYEADGDIPSRSWWEAQRIGKDLVFDLLSEDEREERLNNLRDQFLGRFGPAIHAASKQSPEALLLAVQVALGADFERALDYLGYHRCGVSNDHDEFADF